MAHTNANGATAVPAPELNIPSSQSTVKVSIIDTSTRIGGLPIQMFFTPDIPGHPAIRGPAYSFLIENEAKNEKIVFDLGVRKDHENMAKSLLDAFKDKGYFVSVPSDVATILTENSVPLSSISAVIWSHYHFDHIGDPSTFPPTTALVVGSGFSAAQLPPYPENPNSAVTADAFEGRELREVAFDTGLKLGRFNAVDYFGDGSFYLLDTPGHCAGHICGLARTSTSPDSFIFMGGDAAHHGGEFRPTTYLPIPETISPSPYQALAEARNNAIRCPGEVFVQAHPNKSATEPFYQPTTGGATEDPAEAARTLGKLEEFDARDDVFVVIAHDASLLDVVDFFPKPANAWKEKGWREQGLWRFLGDFTTSVSEGYKSYWYA